MDLATDCIDTHDRFQQFLYNAHFLGEMWQSECMPLVGSPVKGFNMITNLSYINLADR